MKITIIGGGAAGMMAAAAIHEADTKVEIFLIEKNDGLGKKVIISGGGRCNLTTGIRDIKTVLSKYPRGGRFLSKAMHKFSPEAVFAWFESHGVPLKVEADMRVFPKSNDGKDVVAVFEKIFRGPSIKVLFNSQVENVERSSKGFEIFLKGKAAPLSADKLILTTGGQAYRQTGSTGDGYGFAVSLGHSLTPLAPSLSSFTTAEKWPAEVSGVSFEKAELFVIPGTDPGSGSRSRLGGRDDTWRVQGPFLFTHRGLSGPAVFALSSLTAFASFDVEHPLEISADIFPDRTSDDLRKSLEANIAANPKKSLVNIVAMLIPKSLAEIVCRELKLPAQRHSAEIGKKDTDRIIGWLKGIPFHVVARGTGDEFVTAGGVDLKEVDSSTMESKICPGLYLAGEILAIDGFTGGFNLQSAWATGRLAGQNAARNIGRGE